jgi:putative peptide zinc metalloprotease protein
MKFFGWLADHKLLDEESAAHPLLKPFTKQSYALEHGLVKPKSFEELATTMAPTTTPPRRRSARRRPCLRRRCRGTNEPRRCSRGRALAAGVNEAENLDPRAAGRAWKLFEIKAMLAALLPLVSPLKWVVYLLPFLGLSALILAIRYANSPRRTWRRCTR